MDIKNLKRLISDYLIPVSQTQRISLLIQGKHGIGKSQVIKDFCAENEMEFIDLRLGQLEPGDLLGYPQPKTDPKTGKETTVFFRPDFWPDEGTKGILFLDEMNRGDKQIRQAIMQLALDYKLHDKELPEGWLVMAAINDNADEYQIEELDPALFDRFLVKTLTPTVEEWLDWAIKGELVHDAVIFYISKHPGNLDAPDGGMEAGTIYPSRRSWGALGTLMKNQPHLLQDEEMLSELAMGFIGSSIGLEFLSFIKNNYEVLTPLDILENPKKTEKFVEKRKNDPLVFSLLNQALSKYIAENYSGKNSSKFTDTRCNNMLTYMACLPDEFKANVWAEIAARGGFSGQINSKLMRGIQDRKDLKLNDFLISMSRENQEF